MAVCRYCENEMNGSTSCVVVSVDVKAGQFQPVAYGGEPDTVVDGRRCHDCDVLPGGYHHRGCDWEVCPNCHRQLIAVRRPPAMSAGRWTEDHFCNRIAIVTLDPILAGAVVPLLVYRDREGAWQVLDGGSLEGRSVAIAYVTDVADIHPSLDVCLDLPPGWEAWRDTLGGPWFRAEVAAGEES